MANIQDLERKHSQFITSQNNIVDAIASYGVNITKQTPFKDFAGLVKDAVSTKLAGLINGSTEVNLEERDFKKIAPVGSAQFIRRYAFYLNAAVKGVVIPDWITSIEINAFYGCTGLKTVVIKGQTSIQSGSFLGCTSLEKVYLPNVTSENRVPTLANVSAFTNTTCIFVVSSEEIKTFYTSASNWNTLADRFIVEEISA